MVESLTDERKYRRHWWPTSSDPEDKDYARNLVGVFLHVVEAR
jgi:hypothetical protein